MKELDDAILSFVRTHDGKRPDLIYLGRLQLQMLMSSQARYNHDAEIRYRGIRIIITNEEDHLSVTEAMT